MDAKGRDARSWLVPKPRFAKNGVTGLGLKGFSVCVRFGFPASLKPFGVQRGLKAS